MGTSSNSISHGCQYRGSWDSSGRPGHYGHRADICGPAHRRHHTHHRSGLVPVSTLGLHHLACCRGGPSVVLGHQAAWHPCQGLRKRLSLACNYCAPCLIPAAIWAWVPDSTHTHPLISPQGTSSCYTTHSIKPFGDWETHCLQSQHKSAKSVLVHNTSPWRPGQKCGPPRLAQTFSLCFPFQWRNTGQMFPSDPRREQGVPKDNGKKAGIIKWNWFFGSGGKFQEQYPRPLPPGPILCPFPLTLHDWLYIPLLFFPSTFRISPQDAQVENRRTQ